MLVCMYKFLNFFLFICFFFVYLFLFFCFIFVFFCFILFVFLLFFFAVQKRFPISKPKSVEFQIFCDYF